MTLTALFEIHWSDYSSDLLVRAAEDDRVHRRSGFAGAAVLGLILALMRLSPTRALRIPAAIYTELFKNIPLLAIIFLIYFGLPSQGIKLNVFTAGALSLIIFYAAYLSEIFRAAIAGVHGGQQEASEALGLSRLRRRSRTSSSRRRCARRCRAPTRCSSTCSSRRRCWSRSRPPS